jgi:hypothetical protein
VVTGLKHQKEKRSMDHFAGLDVSVKETSVCVVDDTGKIVREVKVASEPEALLHVLGNPAYITLRRRDDAGDALRSGPDHAGAFRKMVVAQGLGDEDRQTPRDEKGNRGLGASVGRDHAPHMG